MTPHEFEDRLLRLLRGVPALQEKGNRTVLLRRLPDAVVSGVPRADAMLADLHAIVSHAMRAGQLSGGDRAALLVLENARLFTEGSETDNQLAALASQFPAQAASLQVAASASFDPLARAR